MSAPELLHTAADSRRANSANRAARYAQNPYIRDPRYTPDGDGVITVSPESREYLELAFEGEIPIAGRRSSHRGAALAPRPLYSVEIQLLLLRQERERQLDHQMQRIGEGSARVSHAQLPQIVTLHTDLSDLSGLEARFMRLTYSRKQYVAESVAIYWHGSRLGLPQPWQTPSAVGSRRLQPLPLAWPGGDPVYLFSRVLTVPSLDGDLA